MLNCNAVSCPTSLNLSSSMVAVVWEKPISWYHIACRPHHQPVRDEILHVALSPHLQRGSVSTFPCRHIPAGHTYHPLACTHLRHYFWCGKSRIAQHFAKPSSNGRFVFCLILRHPAPLPASLLICTSANRGTFFCLVFTIAVSFEIRLQKCEVFRNAARRLSP